MENGAVFEQQSKPQLLDFIEVRQYCNNNNPNRKEFCKEMKKYNATYGQSMKTWEYLYTEKAIEYETLRRKSQKYEYILMKLLPQLKSLGEKQKQQENKVSS
eukprot:187372_1